MNMSLLSRLAIHYIKKAEGNVLRSREGEGCDTKVVAEEKRKRKQVQPSLILINVYSRWSRLSSRQPQGSMISYLLNWPFTDPISWTRIPRRRADLTEQNHAKASPITRVSVTRLSVRKRREKPRATTCWSSSNIHCPMHQRGPGSNFTFASNNSVYPASNCGVSVVGAL